LVHFHRSYGDLEFSTGTDENINRQKMNNLTETEKTAITLVNLGLGESVMLLPETGEHKTAARVVEEKKLHEYIQELIYMDI